MKREIDQAIGAVLPDPHGRPERFVDEYRNEHQVAVVRREERRGVVASSPKDEIPLVEEERHPVPGDVVDDDGYAAESAKHEHVSSLTGARGPAGGGRRRFAGHRAHLRSVGVAATVSELCGSPARSRRRFDPARV